MEPLIEPIPGLDRNGSVVPVGDGLAQDRIETHAVPYGAMPYQVIPNRTGARVARPVAELLWLLPNLRSGTSLLGKP